jgi:hypothetical protein
VRSCISRPFYPPAVGMHMSAWANWLVNHRIMNQILKNTHSVPFYLSLTSLKIN